MSRGKCPFYPMSFVAQKTQVRRAEGGDATGTEIQVSGYFSELLPAFPVVSETWKCGLQLCVFVRTE